MTQVTSPHATTAEIRDDLRLLQYYPQYWQAEIQLYIDWQNSTRGWRWAEWEKAHHAGDKEFNVHFTLDYAKKNADRYRDWYPQERVYFYGIPYLNLKTQQPERGGLTGQYRFWALVITANMSIFEVTEGHIYNDRKHAMIFTYDEFMSLEGTGQDWHLPVRVGL